MSQLGRISGQLLKDNLTRNGHDLAFDTDLLYLDVTNRRIGIKNVSPDTELDVNGTTQTTNIIVTNQSDLGDITVLGNTITSNTGILNLTNATGDQVNYQTKLVVDNIDINGNVISTNSTDVNLVLDPTGSVEVYADTNVYGNITATGDIQADGNIIVGNANTDNITFNAEVASNIIPNENDEFTLGNVDYQWKDLWVKNIHAVDVNSTSLTVGGIDMTLRQGNIYYVSSNGSDTNSGTHQNDPFLTIKHALAVATSGTTVYIYPGTYAEEFPLTVPVKVDLKGAGIRSVKIVPTAGTNDKDAFLINGDATIEDITVADFYFNNTNNTGYAFKFASNFIVDKRSPYIRNVSVLTKGSITSGSDPRGFLTGDAGKGAYIDGSVANAASKEAAMLFHSATFICPGVDAITCINGARVEWLNSFTYFANKSMNLLSGTSGFAGAGKTRIKITNKTGTWAVGNTLSYYDTDGTTILATGTISSIDGSFYNIDGRVLGFEQIQDRASKTITVHGNAKLSTVVKKFGTASLALDGTGDYLTVPTQADFEFGTFHRLPKALTVNGNAVVSSTQSKFGGSSIYFDGSGDYITIPTTTDFGFGTGNFTIEAWVYRTASNGSNQEIFDFRTTSAQVVPLLYLSVGGIPIYAVNTVSVITGGAAITNNTWTHIAVSKSGNSTKLFVNGTQSGSTYTDNNTYLSTAPLYLGARYDGVASFLGYIDEVRVSNTARYTGTFTPSTSAFSNDYNTKLLVHGNSDISDDGGVQTVGDFTLEAWIYNTSQPAANQVIIDLRTADPQVAPTFYINATTNTLRLAVNGSSVIDSVSTIPLNTWTHVALSRYTTSTKMFINGSQVGSTYTDTNTYIQGAVTVGARFDGTTAFFGYIDDVKISKGIARYTTTFTAPIAQLTGDLNTVLLINCNGTNNSTAIADNGITLQDLRTSAGGRSNYIDFADYSDFGVEVRSIASAGVYGNYGVYGDGAGVIAYLIGQNLAYIGNGKESSNDPTTVIQANEIVELNKAKIYYNSVDHKGDFRVGELFYVNQQTGEVSFTNSNVTIGTSLTFDNGLGDVTFLDATKIETGDFRISGNTIQTLTQDFNVSAASNLINLQSNVNISGNLDVTGNVTIGGNITIGDQSSDTVSFVAGVNSDIVPTNPSGLPTYNLGTSSLQWLHLYASQISIADVQIDTNVIRTTATDTDLTLRANGSGKIYVPSNNVLLNQNLTVNGTTTVKDTNIGTVGTPATLTHIGALNQTGDLTQTGNINLTGTFTTSSYAQFADILITGDQLKTTLNNNDLTLSAHGTGKVYIPSNDVQIDNNLTVTGYIDVNTINLDTTISAARFTTGDIVIEDNTIYTTLNNNNLILEAAGSGKIYVPTNDVQLDQALTVNGTTTLATTNIVGTVTHTGAVTQTGDLTQTGSTEITGTLTVGSTAQFQDIKIDTNTVRTTLGNNNLQLSAAGTGRIYVPTNDVTIENTLTVLGTTTTSTISNTGTVTSGTFNTSNVSITNNNITSRTGNSNLVLEAAGSGKIYVPSNSVQLDQNLTVNGTTYLKDTTVVGTVTHTGAVTQTGNLTQTGSTEITGTLTVGSTAQFQDIKIDTNVITTTIGNNNLILKANGTGIVIVPEDNVSITQTLTVTGTTSTTTINNTGTITSDTFNTSNVSINGNTITSRTGDSNLVLEASGIGKIYVPNNNVNLGKTLTVNGNTALADTSITGTLTITGATTQTGDVDQTGNYTLRGNLTVDNIAQFKDVNITNNVITTTVGNNNLQLSAAGTGRIYVPTNNVTIENNLTVVGTTTTSTINNSGTVTSGTFSTGNISINGNTIQTTASNSNLQLQAAGTGFIQLEQFDVQENEIRINTGSDMVLTPNGFGIVSVNSTQSIKIPVGATADRPTGAAGMIRFNTDLTRYEGYNGTAWVRLDGIEDADGNTKITAELTPGANDNTIRFYTNGTQVADLNSTRLNVANLDVGAINVNNNVISTTTTNTNLVLAPNGTGAVRIGNFSFNSNVITNTVNNSITYINQTGNGYVKISNTGGFVIPTGLTEQRPPLFAVGMLRYNTDPGNFRVEVWDGANWVNAGQAAGGGVTVAEATDIGIVSAIIFG